MNLRPIVQSGEQMKISFNVISLGMKSHTRMIIQQHKREVCNILYNTFRNNLSTLIALHSLKYAFGEYNVSKCNYIVFKLISTIPSAIMRILLLKQQKLRCLKRKIQPHLQLIIIYFIFKANMILLLRVCMKS